MTKWTKLDTQWHGVSVDDLLAAVEVDPLARFVTAHSYGGYTTNLPLTDIVNNQAFVALAVRRRAARAAAWRPGATRGAPPLLLEECEVGARPAADGRDEPGFWESLGFHNRGDPWREERYSGD